MARIITKELAIKIADKLKATPRATPGAHTIYDVYHDGLLVATFGIRHGSEKDAGHDHIPRDLGVGPNLAKQFGQCSKQLRHLVSKWRETGRLPTKTEEHD